MPLLAAATLSLAVLAGQPARSAERIERLIAQLGSDDWHQREAAAAAIRPLGLYAIAPLERALKSPDPEVRFRARALLDELRWQPPKDLPPHLADALKHYPALPNERRRAVIADVAEAARARAVPFLRQVLEADPALNVRETALDHLCRLDARAAEAGLRSLAASAQRRGWALAKLGDLLVAANRIDAAVAAYEAARKAGSTKDHVPAALATLYERKADYPNAIRVYTELARQQPRVTAHTVRIGWCHWRMGHRDQAEAVWRTLLTQHHHDRDGYVLVDRIYQQTGQRARRVGLLREACRRHPHDFDLCRRLGSALVSAAKVREAIPVYRRAVELAPSDYQRRAVSRELGLVLRAAGRAADYLEHEERELKKLDREIAPAMRRLAERLIAAGDRARARRLLQRLIHLYPDSPEARWATPTLRSLPAND